MIALYEGFASGATIFGNVGLIFIACVTLVTIINKKTGSISESGRFLNRVDALLWLYFAFMVLITVATASDYGSPTEFIGGILSGLFVASIGALVYLAVRNVLWKRRSAQGQFSISWWGQRRYVWTLTWIALVSFVLIAALPAQHLNHV